MINPVEPELVWWHVGKGYVGKGFADLFGFCLAIESLARAYIRVI